MRGLAVGAALLALGSGVAASGAGGEPAARASATCSQYNVTGTWRTTQGNGYHPTFTLRQRESSKEVSGRATLPGSEAARAGFADSDGPVDGTVDGDRLDVTVKWRSTGGRTVLGRYTATVEPTTEDRGRLVGGQAGTVSWTGTGALDCSGEQRQRPCVRTYMVMPSGARINANVFRTSLSRKRRRNILEREEAKYEDAGSYDPISARPSNDENCAGFVMRKAFGIRKGNIDPDDLLKQVLRPFGQKVRRGAASAGDIVVYRVGAIAKHVAIVESGGIRVRILSKDQLERVYRATLPRISRSNDPLIQAHGEYEIWRLEPGTVQIVDVTEGDCP